MSHPQDQPQALLPLAPDNAVFAQQVASMPLQQPAQPYRTVLFSPDGRFLVSSTLEQLAIWDVDVRRPIAQRALSGVDLAFGPGGDLLAAAGKEIAFLDPHTLRTTGSLAGHRGGTTALGFSPDGRLLATAGMDGLVRIGDLNNRRLVHTLEHQAPVRGLVFSPDGTLLVTVAWGEPEVPGRVALWHARTGKKLAMIHADREKNLRFSPDGRLLAIDGRIYDVQTGDQRVDLHERLLAFSPDGRLIASCRSDFTTIGLWDRATLQKIAVLKGHTESIWSLAFSPDGRLLASSSGKLDMRALLNGRANADPGDKSIRLWGVAESHLPETQPFERPADPGQTRPLRRLDESDTDDLPRRLWK